MVQSVRRLRQERNLSSKATRKVILSCASSNARGRIEPHGDLVRELARIEDLEFGEGTGENCVSEILTGIAEVFLPVPETDRGKEIDSMRKELEATRSYVDREAKKLANENFVDQAPASVVEATRRRVEDAKSKLEAIGRKLGDLDE